MKTTKLLLAVTLICTFAYLPICTFAQVANGTGAGNCLSFDGVNDYVEVANSASLNPTSAITISVWINPTTATQEQKPIIMKSYTNNNNPPYYQYMLSWVNKVGYIEQVAFWLTINGVFTQIKKDNAFSPGGWHHVVGSYDGTTMRLYIDGVEVALLSIGGTISSYATPLHLGRYKDFPLNSTYVYNGRSDEFAIWNYALTQTEIRDNMCKKLTGNESGLMGYWRFDEASGSTAYDASGNGNNGTLY